MTGTKQQTRDELLREIEKYQWVHSIDLGDGVVTPGIWGSGNPSLQKAINEIDFRGKKVLDIGCWDGLHSFLAERRGAAEVYATDLVSHRDFTGQPTFKLVHQILDSKVKYHPQLSVYHVDRLGVTDFDVVVFAGVYYHIKDPLRAFTSLRRVMKEGAVIVVEGAIIDLDKPAGAEAVNGAGDAPLRRDGGEPLRRRLRAILPFQLRRRLRDPAGAVSATAAAHPPTALRGRFLLRAILLSSQLPLRPFELVGADDPLPPRVDRVLLLRDREGVRQVGAADQPEVRHYCPGRAPEGPVLPLPRRGSEGLRFERLLLTADGVAGASPVRDRLDPSHHGCQPSARNVVDVVTA